jgi:hypothetical protein
MESQHFDLAEEEFSKESKIILWTVASFFFLTGIFILYRTYVLKHLDISGSLSIAPFGISLVVSLIASYATIKRKELFFNIDDEKIEFRFGIISPKKHLFQWVDIKELIVPMKQKKVMLIFKDEKVYEINLNWIGKKKSVSIIKHIYQFAKEKNIHIVKVKLLVKHSPGSRP